MRLKWVGSWLKWSEVGRAVVTLGLGVRMMACGCGASPCRYGGCSSLTSGRAVRASVMGRLPWTLVGLAVHGGERLIERGFGLGMEELGCRLVEGWVARHGEK